MNYEVNKVKNHSFYRACVGHFSDDARIYQSEPDLWEHNAEHRNRSGDYRSGSFRTCGMGNSGVQEFVVGGGRNCRTVRPECFRQREKRDIGRINTINFPDYSTLVSI